MRATILGDGFDLAASLQAGIARVHRAGVERHLTGADPLSRRRSALRSSVSWMSSRCSKPSMTFLRMAFLGRSRLDDIGLAPAAGNLRDGKLFAVIVLFETSD